MDINIYNEERTTNYYGKPTISSMNKRKDTSLAPQYSQSDFTVKSYIQHMVPHTDFYAQGQQFLSQKEERREYLKQKLEAEEMKQCSFSPRLDNHSRMLSSLSMVSSKISTKSKMKESMIDTQSAKLEQELQECTFKPRILKVPLDKFDRTEPVYDRHLQWKKSTIAKNHEKQALREQHLYNSSIITSPKAKQLDLRAQHRLKKNVSARYLLGQFKSLDSSTRETFQLLQTLKI